MHCHLIRRSLRPHGLIVMNMQIDHAQTTAEIYYSVTKGVFTADELN